MDWGLLLGFLFGIVGSLIAAYFYDTIKTMINDRLQKLDIEGSWGEFVKDSKGRQFTFGRIHWDAKQKIYKFDGTNFENNGAPYCHFYTVTSYIDRPNRQFFYTFKAELEDGPDRVYYGFGVVNLVENKLGRLSPANGHYFSANVDGKGMSHSMIRTNDMSYQRQMDGSEVISFIRSKALRNQTRPKHLAKS